MKPVVLVPLVVFALALTGCQPKKPAGPKTAKVSGTVTLDGKPMEGGEVRFALLGHPPQVLQVKGGAFSGDVFVGQNQVDVLWEKDGAPNPMNPGTYLRDNVVSGEFFGGRSPFKPNIGADGAADLKFAVTSARR